MHGFGPAVWSGSEAPYHEQWEARVFGLWAVSAAEGLGAGSGRVLREEMTPEHYLRATYYERWQWSNEQRLLRKGAIHPGEVETWVERLRSGEAPPSRHDADQARRVRTWLAQAATLEQATDTRFGPGERVRVRRMRPAGHTRCPRYVRGAEGIVERVRGADVLPDVGPYQGPVEPVYSIAFRSEHLFGPNEGGTWTIMVDLYESYLEPM
jgi:hypothetical protein